LRRNAQFGGHFLDGVWTEGLMELIGCDRLIFTRTNSGFDRCAQTLFLELIGKPLNTAVLIDNTLY
jgi:hypothetical protein